MEDKSARETKKSQLESLGERAEQVQGSTRWAGGGWTGRRVCDDSAGQVAEKGDERSRFDARPVT